MRLLRSARAVARQANRVRRLLLCRAAAGMCPCGRGAGGVAAAHPASPRPPAPPAARSSRPGARRRTCSRRACRRANPGTARRPLAPSRLRRTAPGRTRGRARARAVARAGRAAAAAWARPRARARRRQGSRRARHGAAGCRGQRTRWRSATAATPGSPARRGLGSRRHMAAGPEQASVLRQVGQRTAHACRPSPGTAHTKRQGKLSPHHERACAGSRNMACSPPDRHPAGGFHREDALPARPVPATICCGACRAVRARTERRSSGGAGPVPSQKRSASSDSGVSERLAVEASEPCAPRRPTAGRPAAPARCWPEHQLWSIG